MSFAQPLWLLGLPLIALIAVLLMLRRPGAVATVPFVELWRTPGAPPRPAQRGSQLRPLPAYAVLGLLAGAAAMFAAAEPHWALLDAPGRGLVVVVDRGLGMSTLARESERPVAAPSRSRLLASAERLSQRLTAEAEPRLPVRLAAVPPLLGRGEWSSATTAGDLAELLRALPPTAVDTSAAVVDVATTLCRQQPGLPLLVLTDATMPSTPGVIALPPPVAAGDVGIANFSAVDRPQTAPGQGRREVMVRLFNHSDTPRELTVEFRATTGATARLTQTLPARSQAAAFASMPLDSSDWLEARVLADKHAPADAQPANDAAYLVRTPANPRFEPRGALSAEVLRVMEAYAEVRPPEAGARSIPVRATAPDAPDDENESILTLPATTEAAMQPAVGAAIVVRADWLGLTPARLLPALEGGRLAAPPGDRAAWRPLVEIDGVPVVAESTRPPRRVWIGLNSASLAASPAFVVLWSSVMDSFTSGAPHAATGRWTSSPVTPVDPSWRMEVPSEAPPVEYAPGVYRRPDGQRIALHASPALPTDRAPAPEPDDDPWGEALRRALREASRPPVGAPATARTTPALAAAMALALSVSAALAWSGLRGVRRSA